MTDLVKTKRKKKKTEAFFTLCCVQNLENRFWALIEYRAFRGNSGISSSVALFQRVLKIQSYYDPMKV